jgi:hypothetical protein
MRVFVKHVIVYAIVLTAIAAAFGVIVVLNKVFQLIK